MKKSLIIILLAFFNNFIIAQTYRDLFDKLDKSSFFQNGYYSFYSNFKSNLTFEAYKVMQAYINMYKATKDIKYLNEFVIHAKRVMDRRDDRIANASPVYDVSLSNNCPGLNQFSDQLTNKVGWSRIEEDCVLYPHHIETGIITYPMAEFIILTIDNPDLLTIILPIEAVSTGITNFGDFAAFLKTNINQSLQWHINNGDWHADIGRFVSPITQDYSFNQQCAIGRTLILMYYISYLDGNANNTYRNIIENIGYFFYNELHNNPGSNNSSPSTVGNGLAW